MTTKEYLNQIHKIDLMIEAKLDEIASLREMACRITIPTNSEKVKTSLKTDKLTDTVDRIIRVEKEIDKMVEELIQKRKTIIGQIDAIEDPDYYSFLTYRYIQQLPTKEIASKMGIAHSAMFRTQKEALQEFEKIHGSEYLQ